uniref:Uncharacterized protein n=1 Tax=Acrobeloides nanus TaxID=290746 RepID=A0A914DHX2_9BILA
MVHGDQPLTKEGNPAAPLMEVYLQWIVDAWDQLPKDLIIKSFKNCALTIALDGSEDDQIYCFKPDGPIPSGRALLQQARADEQSNELRALLENVDLAEDENNGYESDVSVDFQFA